MSGAGNDSMQMAFRLSVTKQVWLRQVIHYVCDSHHCGLRSVLSALLIIHYSNNTCTTMSVTHSECVCLQIFKYIDDTTV